MQLNADMDILLINPLPIHWTPLSLFKSTAPAVVASVLHCCTAASVGALLSVTGQFNFMITRVFRGSAQNNRLVKEINSVMQYVILIVNPPRGEPNALVLTLAQAA